MSEMYLEFKQNGLIDIEKYAVIIFFIFVKQPLYNKYILFVKLLNRFFFFFQNADPFLELETEPTLIGTALVEPKCILHKVPLDENSKIYDYLSKLVGTLRVNLIKQGLFMFFILDIIDNWIWQLNG